MSKEVITMNYLVNMVKYYAERHTYRGQILLPTSALWSDQYEEEYHYRDTRGKRRKVMVKMKRLANLGMMTATIHFKSHKEASRFIPPDWLTSFLVL